MFTVDLERDPFGQGEPTFRGLSEGLPRILDVLQHHGIPSTMFLSGEAAKQAPDMIRRVVEEGHELGCHGFDHSLGYLHRRRSRVAGRDILRGRKAVAEATGVNPVAFRAPNFGLDAGLLREIAAAGFLVDSSVLPGRVVRKWRLLPLVDHLGAPTQPYHPRRDDHRSSGGDGILEIPPTPHPDGTGGPVGLGLLNAHGVASLVDVVERVSGPYLMMVSHPWEAVELAAHQRGTPAWVRRACCSDVSGLKEFLDYAIRRWDVATVGEVARAWKLGR